MKKLKLKLKLFYPLILLFTFTACFSGPSGGEDLLGPDKDKNGIRDDVDEWITDQGLDFNKSEALRLMAKNLRLALKHHKDREKSNFYLHEKGSASNCLYFLFERDTKLKGKVTKELYKLSINNEERLLAYADVDSNFSGEVGYLERDLKKTCKFKMSKESL